MRGKAAAVVALLAVVVVACGGGSAPPTTGPSPVPTPPEVEFIKASLSRIADPDVSPNELVALVEGNTAFAWEIFRMARSEDENVFLSPYSIAAALTMILAGARGDTAQEITDALHLELSNDRMHAARNRLDILITTTPRPHPDDDRAPMTVRVANSLWGQAGYPFLEEFLELLAANYDAGVNLVDFVTAAEDARQTINAWVESATEGRIVDLIPEGVIDDMTRLVLVNAIWFKANWAEQFNSDHTRNETFTLLGGAGIQVPMMRTGLRTGYAVGEGYQAARIPYAGDAAMIVVLPDEGRFDEVAAAFGPHELARVRQGWGDYQLDLSLPRFEYRSNVRLKEVLMAMGVEAAFTDPGVPGGADFSGISGSRDLLIQDALHQAFIKVDEEGTEAAAATALIAGITSMPQAGTFTVDRPFIFIIEHTSTGEILFMGQVVDPR